MDLLAGFVDKGGELQIYHNSGDVVVYARREQDGVTVTHERVYAVKDAAQCRVNMLADAIRRVVRGCEVI
jgi:hypothetical protein